MKNKPFNKIINQESGLQAIFLITGIGILARVVFFLLDQQNPIHLFPVNDETHYISTANKLIQNNFIPAETFWHPPLYSYFLAVLISAGFGLRSIVICQMLLGIVGTIFFYASMRKLNKRAAFYSSLIWIIYPFQLFIETRLLSENIYHFLILYLVYILFARQIKARPVIIGMLFSLIILTKTQFILFVPFFILIYFRKLNSSWFIKYSVSILIPIMLISIFNYRNSGREVWFVSYNGPMNLYLGNSKSIEKTLNLRPNEFREYFYKIMYVSNERINDDWAIFEEERQKILIDKTREINSDMGLVIKNLFLKTLNTFHSYETPRNYDLYLLKKQNRYLDILSGDRLYYPLAFFFYAALLLFVFQRKLFRESNNYRLIMYLIICLILPSIIFFNAFRYRLVVVPFLIFLAVIFYGSFYKRILPMTINLILIFFLGTSVVNKARFQKIPEQETYEMYGKALRAKKEYSKARHYFDLASESIKAGTNQKE